MHGIKQINLRQKLAQYYRVAPHYRFADTPQLPFDFFEKVDRKSFLEANHFDCFVVNLLDSVLALLQVRLLPAHPLLVCLRPVASIVY